MLPEKVCHRCLSYMNDDVLIGWMRCPSCGFCKKNRNAMIILKELNIHNYPTTPDIDSNLYKLLTAINIIRTDWGKPMIVTSGLRSEQDQQKLIADGKSNAHKSNHLIGAAVDILDEDGSLNKYLKCNDKLLEDAGLWCEERQGNWQHFQIFPPKSGNRWFKP